MNKMVFMLVLAIQSFHAVAATDVAFENLLINEKIHLSPPVETVEQVVARLFNNISCFNAETQRALKRKLSRLNVNEVPPDVLAAIASIKDNKPIAVVNAHGLEKIIYLYSLNGSELKTLDIQNGDINPIELTATNGADFLFYTLDCSGYVSAMAKAAANSGPAVAEIAYDGGIDTEKSVNLIIGFIRPALLIAIDENAVSGLYMSDATRLRLLSSLLNELGSTTEEVAIPKTLRVISMSKSSLARIQGVISSQVQVGVSYVIGEVSTDLGAAASYKQSLQFGNYETSILERNESATFGLGRIRKSFGEALGRIELNAKIVNDYVYVKSGIPDGFCRYGDWKVDVVESDSSRSVLKNVSVNPSVNERICEMKFQFSGNDPKKRYLATFRPNASRYKNWNGINLATKEVLISR